MAEPTLAQFWIDRDSPVPIYQQIEEKIEKLIRSGAWQLKEPLPSETLLAEHLQISVMTVRQAMTRLVSKGLIYREKGRGTFILPQPVEHAPQRLESFSEDMRARELASSSRLLIFKIVPAPSIVAVRLGLKRGTKVLRVKRLRLVENRPAALHDAYLTRLDLDHAALERIGSLYTLLEQQGITLVEAEETLEATLADSEIADLLEVPCHAPLLKITRLAWDRHHTPVEFLVACYRADFYRYAVRLRR